MKCQKCKEVGVESEALGKKFWYCRSCKIEIEEEDDNLYGFINGNTADKFVIDLPTYPTGMSPYILHIDDDGQIKPYPSVSMDTGEFLKNT